MPSSRMFQFACLSAVSFLMLSACSGSGEPSSSDVQAAITEQVAAFAEWGLVPGDAEVHDVKVLDCVAGEGDPSYNCNVEYQVTASYNRSRPETVPITETMRFIKGSDGWTVRN